MAPGRRLLFLLPFAPQLDARHGGARVAAQLITFLGHEHRIALLYLRGAAEPAVDPGVRSACEIIIEIPRPWTGHSPFQQLVRAIRLLRSVLFDSRPLWVKDCQSEAYATELRRLARQWQPDVVHIEYHVMGQYIPALNGCRSPRVLTEYEPGVRAAPYMARALPALAQLIHRLDRRAWIDYETRLLSDVQAVVVFTERDRSVLSQLGQPTPIQRIPFGVIVPEQPLDALGQTPPMLLFIGSFAHPPNTDAAMRLVERIFPLVLKRCPQATLWIVGENPPAELRQLNANNVNVTGAVPRIEPYLDRATAVVVPLRLGGGMRVKVLEALAAGKAIVASHLAVEGLDIASGEQLMLADTDEEFASRVIELVEDPTGRAALARRARQWASQSIGWQRSLEAYEKLYERLSWGAQPGLNVH